VAESERPHQDPGGHGDGGTIRVPAGDWESVADRRRPHVGVRVTPHSTSSARATTFTARSDHREGGTGAEIDVPTIHGTVRAKIPPGTQGRQRFPRGKGVKDP
jgi:hypothetical protein